MTRPILAAGSRFTAGTAQKVERLLEVLGLLHGDPVLGSAFVLHGGTAINVFRGDLARLSVDLDLMYVAGVEVDAMRRDRPTIDARLRGVLGKLGYVVRGTNDEHSGQTYRLKYDDDVIKLDVSYLARVALLEPVVVACTVAAPTVSFRLLQPDELWAGKVKALTERTAARDLYDLYRLSRINPQWLQDPPARALVVRAVSASDAFPGLTDPLDALRKFARPSRELTDPLHAVLATGESVDFPEMCAAVAELLRPVSQLSVREAEYVRLLAERSGYRPELLFAEWPEVLERARIDPVMKWKALNLRKR